MRYEAYYSIRPKESLRERANRVDPDMAEFLSEPVLWTGPEGGRTALREDDYVAQAKVLFLLNLWAEYVLGAGDDQTLKIFLEEILGQPPFDEEAFNTWWTLDHYEGLEGSFEELAEMLAREHPQLLANSGLPVAAAALSRYGEAVPA